MHINSHTHTPKFLHVIIICLTWQGDCGCWLWKRCCSSSVIAENSISLCVCASLASDDLLTHSLTVWMLCSRQSPKIIAPKITIAKMDGPPLEISILIHVLEDSSLDPRRRWHRLTFVRSLLLPRTAHPSNTRSRNHTKGRHYIFPTSQN